MNIVRKVSKNRLALSGIDEREADYILSYELNIPITDIPFSTLDLSKKQYNSIIKKIKLRCRHMPITKIFKKAYFYGVEFVINEHVLSPRFDTELLVEKALEYIKPNDRVLDLCTGSGCVAISIAKNVDAYVEASDISKKALKVAKKNIKVHGAKVEAYQSNMFDKVQGKFNVIVSNPPYIESEVVTTLENEVKEYDPLIALDGGVDGLDFYREIANKIKNYLLDDGILLMEIGYNQGDAVREIFKSVATNIEIVKDYNNNDRVVIVKI
ncbi:MAG: peptide chain release factor N(5)-glutamine methyltransferase [Candidatus Gastranaerophilales bacterium]|nr:peptide chain release factor N(5)-glutamine methyltransferase [Candidatus Gastranaerophilales bacterium]